MEQDPRYNGGDRYGRSGSSLSGWIIPIVMLFIFPPVGVLLIALNLFGGSWGRGRQVRGRHPYYTQQQGGQPMGARTAGQTSASYEGGEAAAQSVPTASNSYAYQYSYGYGTAGEGTERGGRNGKASKRRSVPGQDPLARQSKKAKNLIGIGGAVAAIFAFASAMTFVDTLSWGGWRYLLEDMLPLLTFTAGGVGAWWAGMRQKKKLRRYRQYLAMIGPKQAVSMSALSSAMGRSPEKVREDLQDMLDEGCFPAGYLDYGGDMLVLSDGGLRERPKPEPERKAKPSPGEEENAVLAEIRAVNEAIAHPALSAQIDRIGVITAKIFDYQKTHPEKSPQLHSFLSYYLPTTLKILRAYAQLESQGIEGANITAAKKRIEGMMDKVVEGFEKQLDQLFQGDVLDVTTDVQVLEQMLAKDGLSSGEGIQLSI